MLSLSLVVNRPVLQAGPNLSSVPPALLPLSFSVTPPLPNNVSLNATTGEVTAAGPEFGAWHSLALSARRGAQITGYPLAVSPYPAYHVITVASASGLT